MSVSFLIPVFRVELDWFKQAMSSVFRELDQTKAPGYEVVIVNDGTEQQDLIEYLAELEKDDRVVVVDSGKNLGVAGALNLGIEHCKNGLIARMDADDIILPGRLKKQIHYMNMNR